MSNSSVGDAVIAVVRRNTEEVQGKGNWRLFEELFADDFVDHTPQPGTTPDKDGVRVLYKRLRAAFPDFHPEIHWQAAAGNLVTTYKTYHGTHQGEFLGIPATGKKVSFYTVVNSRLICATFSLPECATCWGTVSARVNPDRGGKESAISHGAKHDQVPEAAGAVQHADRLAGRL